MATTLAALTCGAALRSTFAATPAEIETARDQFNEGLDLRDKGDLKGALERLVVADKLVHTPITALEVGRTHVMLKQLVEGVEALLSVGRIAKSPTESANAIAARAEAAQLADETTKRIPSLRVTVKGAPDAGLRVVLDGTEVAIDTLVAPRRLNPGPHVVVASAPGCVEQTIDVVLEEREARELTITLSPSDALATTTARPSFGTEDHRTTPVLAYIGFGVAGAGIVFGGVTGVLAFAKASRVKDECPTGACTTAEGQDALKSGRTFATISTVSFVVAGAGAAVGVLALVLRPSSAAAKPERARLTPFVGVGSIGLAGEF